MYRRFKTDIRKFWRYAVYSSRAQLKSEVANSYLSWLWWILEPFCFMLIYAFIFGTVFNAREPNFPVFIFVGHTLWSYFNKTMVQSVRLVRQNRSIVSKVYLPKFILLMSKIGVNAFKMLVSFVVVAGMLVYYRIPVSANLLFALPILLTLTVINFGLGCFLLHFGVFVEDLSNAINIILRMVFYMTGIFWDIMKRLPAPYNGIICRVNPIAFLLYSMRQCVLYDNAPDVPLLILWFLIGTVISILGIRIIYKNENSYAKVI